MLDNRILNLCTPIIYGSSKATSFHRKLLGIQDFSFNLINDAYQANAKRANLINCWQEEAKIELENSYHYPFLFGARSSSDERIWIRSR